MGRGEPEEASEREQTPLRENVIETALRARVIGQDRRFQRLMWSGTEAQEIASLVPESERMVALGFEANRETAMSGALSRYRIVHFATHGVLDSVYPERSGLVLSLVDEKGCWKDGFLGLRDIYEMNVPVDLVVLSACQTGLGKEVSGEGIVGLTRAFMYAKARGVVASLWKVDDKATAELMKRFYREMLVEGKTSARALRDAQLSMYQDANWRSPFSWAGFVLQGDWQPAETGANGSTSGAEADSQGEGRTSN